MTIRGGLPVIQRSHPWRFGSKAYWRSQLGRLVLAVVLTTPVLPLVGCEEYDDDDAPPITVIRSGLTFTGDGA